MLQDCDSSVREICWLCKWGKELEVLLEHKCKPKTINSSAAKNKIVTRCKTILFVYFRLTVLSVSCLGSLVAASLDKHFGKVDHQSSAQSSCVCASDRGWV